MAFLDIFSEIGRRQYTVLPHGFRFPVRVSTYSTNGASQNGLLIFIASISSEGRGGMCCLRVLLTRNARPPLPRSCGLGEIVCRTNSLPKRFCESESCFFQQFSLPPSPFCPHNYMGVSPPSHSKCPDTWVPPSFKVRLKHAGAFISPAFSMEGDPPLLEK